MKLRVAAETDAGLVRDNNEDAFLSSPPLVAVADGVGGHNAGEVASSLAIEVLRRRKAGVARRGPKRLRQAAVEANRLIHARAQGDHRLQGMATTLTAAWIESGTCTIAQIGDSRAYLFRDGELTQLTEDQTIVAQLVREGRLSPEEAYGHPWRNRILQALGDKPEVVVEMLSVQLRPSDRILLTSDGLTDEVSDDTIAATLRVHTDAESAARALVHVAKASGGRDNITVVVVEVSAEQADVVEPSRLRRLVGRLSGDR